ncbi:MAG: hypothetical protein OXG04_05560 [Acidobacteria bacterium]|nr:hypothetical protein [Acidobacteriota bacterium]
MRTTIDIPERLLRQAKAEAALRGLGLKDIVRDALEITWRMDICLISPARRRSTGKSWATVACSRSLPAPRGPFCVNREPAAPSGCWMKMTSTAKSILADVNVWLAIPLERSRRSTPTW